MVVGGHIFKDGEHSGAVGLTGVWVLHKRKVR